MDSEDEDVAVRDEVFLIKKANRLAKARHRALELSMNKGLIRELDPFRDNQEHISTRRRVLTTKTDDDENDTIGSSDSRRHNSSSNNINDNAIRSGHFVPQRDEDLITQLVQARNTIKMLEKRNHELMDSKKLMDKELQRVDATKIQANDRKNDLIFSSCDRIMRLITTLERQVLQKYNDNDEHQNSNQNSSRNSRIESKKPLSSVQNNNMQTTITKFLVKIRHGVENIKNISNNNISATDTSGNKSESKSNSNHSNHGKDSKDSILNDTASRRISNMSTPKNRQHQTHSTENDVTDALFDVCSHLEQENQILRDQLVETGPVNISQVKKLIHHYRMAIVRSRNETTDLGEQLRQERLISSNLRQQLKGMQEREKSLMNKKSIHMMDKVETRSGLVDKKTFYTDNNNNNNNNNDDDDSKRNFYSFGQHNFTENIKKEISMLDDEIAFLQKKLERSAVTHTHEAMSKAISSNM